MQEGQPTAPGGGPGGWNRSITVGAPAGAAAAVRRLGIPGGCAPPQHRDVLPEPHHAAVHPPHQDVVFPGAFPEFVPSTRHSIPVHDGLIRGQPWP